MPPNRAVGSCSAVLHAVLELCASQEAAAICTYSCIVQVGCRADRCKTRVVTVYYCAVSVLVWARNGQHLFRSQAGLGSLSWAREGNPGLGNQGGKGFEPTGCSIVVFLVSRNWEVPMPATIRKIQGTGSLGAPKGVYCFNIEGWPNCLLGCLHYSKIA